MRRGGKGFTVFIVAELKHQLIECFRILWECKTPFLNPIRETKIRQRGRDNVEAWCVLWSFGKKRQDLGNF